MVLLVRVAANLAKFRRVYLGRWEIMDKKVLLGCSIALLCSVSPSTCTSALAGASQLQAEEKAQAEARNAQAAAAQRQAAEEGQKVQQQEMRLRQEQAGQVQQQQARQMQEQAQKVQQEEMRQRQLQAGQVQQQQARQMQEQAQRVQQQELQKEQLQLQQRQAQERQVQESAAKAQQLQNAQRQSERMKESEQIQANQARIEERQMRERPASLPTVAPGFSGHAREPGIGTLPTKAMVAFPARRAAAPPPLNIKGLSLNTAAPPPMVAPNLSAHQQQQALMASQNLRAHLIPVPQGQAPQNIPYIRKQQLGYYTNNYPLYLNSRNIYINRENTFVNAVQPDFYPPWYNAQPGWRYCNGLTLGSSVTSGVDWLQAGWEPYWGQQPQGFICDDDYIPTPWIYFPAINAWRQPGSPGYVDFGPPLEYTGPITVEVLEPVRTVFTDQSGYPHREIMNELYFYNAYFYPDSERWGYTNNRGYFIWLNI
jgi:hypothetical protein